MAPSSVSKAKKAPVSKEKEPQASAEDSSAFGPIAERFRRAGDLDRAVSLCREGLQKFPDHISARVTLGWALLELGKYDEAQVELEQVLRRRPDNLAAIRALAELHDRAEQTLNLPMDGPGQWPPTPDAVDEVAGSMVAGSFLALSGEDAAAEPGEIDGLVNSAGAPLHAAPQPAVVPPAELGLAMWSALPATEPEPEPVQEYPGRTLFVGDAIAAAAINVEPEAPPVSEQRAEPEPAQAYAHTQTHASGVSDADLAALLAEADSLDALADAVPAPAVAFQAMAEAADALQDLEPQLVLDEGQDLQSLEELTWGVPADVAPSHVEAARTQAEPHVHEPVMHDATAHVPEVEVETGPVFQLESLSIGAIEALPLEAALAVEAEAWAVDPDLQPILRFDLEPIAEPLPEPVAEVLPEPVAAHVPEPVAAFVAEPAAAVVSEPVSAPVEQLVAEPIAAFVAPPEAVFVPEAAMAAMVPEAVVESAVIAQTQARIAAVVSMARVKGKEKEKEATPGQLQLRALEHFLACVEARRRRVLTESVA